MSLQRLSKRKYTASLAHAHFTTMSGKVETLAFARGITVISGGNGAGKSTLLGALWRCVSGADPEPGTYIPNAPAWLRKIEVIGEAKNAGWKASFDLVNSDRSSDFTGDVFYIDPAAESLEILRLFRLDNQVGDLIEGLDPAPFSSKQVEMLSFILHRSYSEFSVYEVTELREDDAPIPFFLAISMGKQYSIEQMGRGELAAAYLLWRLASVPKGSIVLIEEPESHLAAFSQDCLVDAIVAAAVEQDLCIVVSSHSPGFFLRLPSDNVSLVSSLPLPRIQSELTSRQIATHLGVRDSVKAILLVEDPAASAYARALLEMVDRDALRQVEIKTVSTGESGIKRIMSEVQSESIVIPILGLLDGDQRNSTTDGAVNFLVGDKAPEDVLRDATLKWRSGEFANWLPTPAVDTHELRMALERSDGRDLHDWIHDLAAEFGGLRSIMPVLVNLLLEDQQMREQCLELAKWIRARGNLLD